MPLEFIHFCAFKAKQNCFFFFEPVLSSAATAHFHAQAFSELTETVGDNQ